MPSLPELQCQIRSAVVDGEMDAVAPSLSGGGDPRKRLEIHRRHYEASLTAGLLEKFPATEWLMGTPFLTDAARRFIREHPPQSPCIAEYGERFPQFLAECPGAERVPYLGHFAELEWHVGRASIAADPAWIGYVEAAWPVDELLKLYLTDRAPERLQFEPEHVWLEVRGARGEFSIQRTELEELRMRSTLWKSL